MPRNSQKTQAPELATLVGEIVTDCEKLIGEHFELLRSEVREELHHAGGVALRGGAGAGLVAAGGVLSTLMVVHWLQQNTRLPLWACYGLMAGSVSAAGLSLLGAARREAARVHLPALPQSAGALQEDAAWIQQPTRPRTADRK